MRDLNRIELFCAELAHIWKDACPDWRFGQFISNFLQWYNRDIFYVEDDRMLELLMAYTNME